MKSLYKILIAFAVSLSLVFCSCFTAFAGTTKTYQFITSADQVNLVRLVNPDGSFLDVDGYRVNVGSSEVGISYSIHSLTNMRPQTVLVEVIPDSNFIYYLDDSNYYTFLFSFNSNYLGSDKIDGVSMAMRSSDGRYAYSNDGIQTGISGTYQWYSVTFSPESIRNIKNIESIQVQFHYVNPVSTDLILYFEKDVLVTVSNPTADQIESAIKDSTDKITGGWTPDPDVPEGSESVGELDSIEQELQSSSEEGISAGLSMITSIPDTIFKFRPGLMFFISMSNEIMQIEWLTTLLTIGLSIGIVAFLLNISGSIFSKVSRDNAKRSSGSNNKKSG